MNALLSKYLAPLTLLEWGGIMLYFYLSGRIASFLHPMFRPMVLVAGLLLAVTAVVLLFSGEECCGHGDEEEGHGHSHEHSAWRNVVSFLILLLPIALAAGFSPDSYGANMVRNRGVIANNAPLPRSKTMMPIPAETPAAAATPVAYAGVDNANTGNPTNTTLVVGEPALPTADGEPDPNAAVPSGGFQNPSLKVNEKGHIDADVLDLVYASEEASMMKDFDGKEVEVIGQVVHRKEAEHEKGPFQVIRFLMSCCAADARPVAVLVDYSKKEADFKSMTWVKVTGKVQFKKAGSTTYPVINPTAVKETDAPADTYLY
ncbi:hypothetical protein BH09VER1_BH09VER1_50870 [soil metagenome]